jgi:Phage integrase family
MEECARPHPEALDDHPHEQARPAVGKGFASSFSRAKKLAGLDELHFHDLRGTAATRFYTAGLSERVIAEIMGWEEEQSGRSFVATSGGPQRRAPSSASSKGEHNLQIRQQNQAAAGRLRAP